MFRLKSFAGYLVSVYPKALVGVEVKRCYILLWLEFFSFFYFVFFLRKHSLCKFESLLDIWGIDFIHMLKRFEVNYLLVSLRYNLRVLLKLRLLDISVRSLSSLYYSSVWLERETWDMFGIFFLDHLDLRRILTDYGFSGFPLRKDFPLSGFKECAYEDAEKRVVSTDLCLNQEFRNFGVANRWESSKLYV